MKVYIVAAMSIDGFIGAATDQSSLDWRSKEDGKSFSTLTREAGVMVMGATTYGTFRIKRAPPGRRLIVYTHHPEQIGGEGVETTAEVPRALLARLEQDGYASVAICGGASIHSLFLEANLVDELYLTVEPVIFGQGVPLFRGPLQRRLSLISSTSLNQNTLLLHYQLEK